MVKRWAPHHKGDGMTDLRGLEEVAIVARPQKDNVAALIAGYLAPGTVLTYQGREITIRRAVRRGESFSIVPIEQGESIIALGGPCGIAAADMPEGELIDHSTMLDKLPPIRYRYADHPQTTTPTMNRTFMGFRRADGQVGVRNFVGVVTSGMCSSTEAREIAAIGMRELYSREKFPNVDGVVAIAHESGCGMPNGGPVELLNRILVATQTHPNLGAVLYIDLGCGKTCLDCSVPVFEGAIPNFNQRVVTLGIQNSGGTARAIKKGLEVVEGLLHTANQAERQEAPVSELALGTKCGGSDRWSGLTANAALGAAADRLVQAGGSVLLGEIPELQGAAMLDLVARARSKTVGKKLAESLRRYSRYVSMFGDSFADNPSPGNIKGGLYNIYFKSMGAKAKGGTSVVEDLLEYGEHLGGRKGLYIVYTPGYDQISTPAMFLGGAQLTVFTTGRGTGIGSALGPVIKVSSNTPLYQSNGDIDLNAGTILDGKESVDQVGERLFQEIIEVASGKKYTKAELSGVHTEFKIWEQLWPAL